MAAMRHQLLRQQAVARTDTKQYRQSGQEGDYQAKDTCSFHTVPGIIPNRLCQASGMEKTTALQQIVGEKFLPTMLSAVPAIAHVLGCRL